MARTEWVAARTQYGRERIAARNILLQDHRYYLPRYLTSDKRDALLFPGYIFVALNRRAWTWLTGTRGIAYVLMTGDRPSRVPAKVIRELKRSEGRSGYIRMPEPEAFDVGQEVTALAGSWMGQVGLYAGRAQRDYVRVIYQLLGKDLEVSLPGRLLEAA